MKEQIINILMLAVVVVVLPYLLLSYTALDFNPINWEQSIRLSHVVLTVVAFAGLTKLGNDARLGGR